MASGHVNRIKKAEHMAAPTNAAKREESSCQLGAVHTWHFGDMPTGFENVCFSGWSQPIHRYTPSFLSKIKCCVDRLSRLG
jgi:hypothetical protein